MLNITITNEVITANQEKYTVNHMIVIDEVTNTIKINRIPINGGNVMKVLLHIENDESFTKVMKKIKNICKLDDEIYNLMAEHTNS